jgi:uncharacterized membrane protein
LTEEVEFQLASYVGRKSCYSPGAIILSFVGLVLLLLFIHHTAESIQMNNITARLARETLRAVDHLYPSQGNGPPTEDGTALVQQ